MNRMTMLLVPIGMVLVGAMFFVLIFQPAREDLADVEEQIQTQVAQQQSIQTEIDRLRNVRDQAPRVEAELAVADAIVPRDTALPALVRQLQLAADEAGLTLVTVSTSRPSELDDPPADGLSSLDVNTQIQGGYFQLVDFLRRVEDPAITPRGITWSGATLSRDDGSYPDLTVSLTGSAYAVVPAPAEPEPEPAPDAEDDGDESIDGDGELDGEDQP